MTGNSLTIDDRKIKESLKPKITQADIDMKSTSDSLSLRLHDLKGFEIKDMMVFKDLLFQFIDYLIY